MLRWFDVAGVAGMMVDVGVGWWGRGAGLFGHRWFGQSWTLFVGWGQWDVRLWVQVVSQRSNLLSVPAVRLLHRPRPVLLSSFTNRAVGSDAEETETREAKDEEEEDHRQDEEEDDQQSDSDRVGLSGSSGRAAVHAASVTRVPAVRWSPADVTVTLFVTVTHLAGAAGGALGHGGGVGHVVSKVEEGSSADQVAVVEADRGGQDLCIGAQQGALPPPLTLDPPTVHVMGPHSIWHWVRMLAQTPP